MTVAEGGGIFVSYRRQESSHLAGRLYDRLADRFGESQVFIDVNAIEPGVDFAEEIFRAVAACKVLLAIIGPTWLTATDDGGSRRIDDPDDIVRLEVEAALARRVRVIPILVEGAVMPTRQDLPESLAGLSSRNALHVRHESFRHDAGRLVTAIERVLAVPGTAAVSETNAQRKTNKLSRRHQGQAGALKAVRIRHQSWKGELTVFFEAINGPADVTITGFELAICYRAGVPAGEPSSYMFGSFKFKVEPAEFSLLGIIGPVPGTRLLSNDTAKWQLQTGVLWGLAENQEVQLQFSVTVSDRTIQSNLWKCGSARRSGILNRQPSGTLRFSRESVVFLLQNANSSSYPLGLHNWLSYAVAQGQRSNQPDDLER